MIQAIQLRAEYPSSVYRAEILPVRTSYEVSYYQELRDIPFFLKRTPNLTLEQAVLNAPDVLRDNTEMAGYILSIDVMYEGFTISATFEYVVREGFGGGWETTIHLNEADSRTVMESNSIFPLGGAIWWVVRRSMDIADARRKEV